MAAMHSRFCSCRTSSTFSAVLRRHSCCRRQEQFINRAAQNASDLISTCPQHGEQILMHDCTTGRCIDVSLKWCELTCLLPVVGNWSNSVLPNLEPLNGNPVALRPRTPLSHHNVKYGMLVLTIITTLSNSLSKCTVPPFRTSRPKSNLVVRDTTICLGVQCSHKIKGIIDASMMAHTISTVCLGKQNCCQETHYYVSTNSRAMVAFDNQCYCTIHTHSK